MAWSYPIDEAGQSYWSSFRPEIGLRRCSFRPRGLHRGISHPGGLLDIAPRPAEGLRERNIDFRVRAFTENPRPHAVGP